MAKKKTSMNKHIDKMNLAYKRRTVDKLVEEELKLKLNKFEKYIIKKVVMCNRKRNSKRSKA